MLKVLEVSQIVQGKNIRNERDSEILELAESIEKQGLINPITVQKRDDGKYEVIAGHRRFEAVKRLGLPHIECNIFEDLNEKEIVFAQIAENCQRKDMSASELVDVFEDMKNRFHVDQRQIAKYFGKSDAWVSNQYQAVRILEKQFGKYVPEEEQNKTAGQIKYEARKKLSGMEEVICNGMTVKITGHKYLLFCHTNEAENALRKFIEEHRG